jgi:hypothetical protein
VPNDYLRWFNFQVKLQAVLSTDGNTSFAAFIYEYPDQIHGHYEVGFDAGDHVRGLVLSRKKYYNNTVSSNNTLEEVNIYRIDGMCTRVHNVKESRNVRVTVTIT